MDMNYRFLGNIVDTKSERAYLSVRPVVKPNQEGKIELIDAEKWMRPIKKLANSGFYRNKDKKMYWATTEQTGLKFMIPACFYPGDSTGRISVISRVTSLGRVSVLYDTKLLEPKKYSGIRYARLLATEQKKDR